MEHAPVFSDDFSKQINAESACLCSTYLCDEEILHILKEKCFYCLYFMKLI